MTSNGMPPVVRCVAEQCFYNREQMCHAPAINVGGDHPQCDTFSQQKQHINRQETALVGACHVLLCQHNTDMVCQASSITVANHADHADCSTFQTK